jgi:hypothetical protein
MNNKNKKVKGVKKAEQKGRATFRVHRVRLSKKTRTKVAKITAGRAHSAGAEAAPEQAPVDLDELRQKVLTFVPKKTGGHGGGQGL